eukprot:MONOS_16303.1-p1 / transcript=MONOS_16303.1 / gene=MONOS_16303 / organism=Monocercomonoides_exilis_PA203 / gene_product=unspecified product / transcript_product=unspecified product / location=Mono_scaffold01632:799-1589(-) / protein_length=173 / sequence_SO=supercontig / SO=protein_coding / is_pseudo=false
MPGQLLKMNMCVPPWGEADKSEKDSEKKDMINENTKSGTKEYMGELSQVVEEKHSKKKSPRNQGSSQDERFIYRTPKLDILNVGKQPPPPPPYNSLQHYGADWKQTYGLTEKEGHRPEEAWCEKSKREDKDLRRNEFPVENTSETPQEREGVETGAAPSSVGPPNIRRTLTC